MNSKYKNSFNHLGLTAEEEIFAGHCLDNAILADNTKCSVFSNFLDIREIKIAQAAAGCIGIKCSFFGGYKDAFRVIALFGDINTYPIDCLKILWNKDYLIEHRDILGTIMSLNIDRGVIGDILVTDGEAYVFVKNAFSALILNEVTKIRNVGVKVSICTDPKLPSVTFKNVSIIVSSPRLDSIVSELSKMSREKSANLIKGGKIFVDGKAIDSPSYNLKEGEFISIRGTGKFKYVGIIGSTRSGRNKVQLEMFV